MRKIVSLILLGFALTGCMTGAPKEDIHDIFTLVKQRNFDGAEKKLKDEPTRGWTGRYGTYAGYEIPPYNDPSVAPDSVDSLIKSAQFDINFCDKKVAELKAFHGDRFESTEERWGNIRNEVNAYAEEFDKKCVKDPLKDDSWIQRIKKYADVDLYSLFLADKAQFDIDMARVNNEITTREKKFEKAQADQEAAEESYEHSPEFYVQKLCEVQGIINNARNYISREKQAANESGFVDKNKMYQAGQTIQFNSDALRVKSAEYKKKFGKTWSSANCK